MYDTGIKKIIEKSFLSVFDTLNKNIEVKKNYHKLISEGSEKYSSWIVENYGTIPLFGINKTAHISSLHVKLHFSGKIDRETYRNISDIENEILFPKEREGGETIQEVIDNAKLKVQRKDGSIEKEIQMDVAILGIAGSGKTTTMKYLMFLSSQGYLFRGHKRFPFFIPLRDIAIKKGFLVRNISNTLETFGFLYSKELGLKIIKSGLALILIDGVDELSKHDQLTTLTEIQDVKKLFPENQEIRSIICLSGRPYSLYRSIEGFYKYDVLELSDDERRMLIKNWYKEVDINKGQKLIYHVLANKMIREISTNPLLLSIICVLYYNEYNIPKREDELFRSCLEGLMGKWDLFRDISRQTPLNSLSITKRIELLSNLAANTLFLKRKIVFSPEDKEIISTCKYIKKYYPEASTAEARDLLVSLYSDFGVIVERSNNIFSFSHLKFHEYLASKWLVDERKEMAFINQTSNYLSWSYTIEYVTRNLKSPFEFIMKLADKVIKNINNEEVDLIFNILKDNEVLLTDKERNVIANKLFSSIKSVGLTIGDEIYFDIGFLYINVRKDINYDKNAINYIEKLLRHIPENYFKNLSPETLKILPQNHGSDQLEIPEHICLLGKGNVDIKIYMDRRGFKTDIGDWSD
jgi:hypothetical protein